MVIEGLAMFGDAAYGPIEPAAANRSAEPRPAMLSVEKVGYFDLGFGHLSGARLPPGEVQAG